MLLHDGLKSANQPASNSLHLLHKWHNLLKARQSTDVTSKHSKAGVVFETGSSAVAQTVNFDSSHTNLCSVWVRTEPSSAHPRATALTSLIRFSFSYFAFPSFLFSPGKASLPSLGWPWTRGSPCLIFQVLGQTGATIPGNRPNFQKVEHH